MKYKCIITTRKGEQITLDLNCSEYHANKLNYVLSRTLDRGAYCGAEVVKGFNETPVKINVIIPEKEVANAEEKKVDVSELWELFKILKNQIEQCYKTGENSLQYEKDADRAFYKILDLIGVNIEDFEKELNAKNSRLYIVKYVKSENVKRIYIYFKDCYYRIIDENMTKLLNSKLEEMGVK